MALRREEEIFCITAGEEISPEWLEAAARSLFKENKSVWVMDLKSLLPDLKITDESPARDAGVAAYLLNPLKDIVFLPFSSERKVYTQKVWEEIEKYIERPLIYK